MFEQKKAADNGAMPEASEVALPGRRRLIAVGAAAGAAGLLLGNSPIGPTPGHADLVRSLRNFLHLDPIVMNFAFEMEELQKEFFHSAILGSAYDGLQGREKNAFNLMAREDMEHFEAIKKLRARTSNKNSGGFETSNASSSRRPRFFNFPKDAFNNRAKMFATALDIKETSLFAYHGVVDLVHKDHLMLAAAIAGVEGRHVALLRELNGMDPIPSAFEGSLGAQSAGKHLSRYGFNGGGRDGVTMQ